MMPYIRPPIVEAPRLPPETIKMDAEEGGALVRALVSHYKRIGRTFRPDFFETSFTALLYGIDKETLIKLVEAGLVPQGIKTPWGVWVKP